uniref:NADH-ubiquinone oxidoreductase chain 2 n=1 Tax=Vampyroteuthis infernalis TaxID=55288 RepID=A7BG34_9MOLL|nr:NADH dehydrogenase subunit 2 [Vampyroteuthis infernalis]BAF73637.1 NADH dehydrogenase subunit 2 [Vampyroteuthis infernalis]
MNNKFFPINFLFIIIMMMSTIISLSSSHWLTMWIGLEMNLMALLPLLNIKGKNSEIESSMKYFIIQSMSSSILLMSSIMIYYYSLSWYSMFNDSIFSLILMLALLLKLGAAPLHLWLPSITKQMSWLMLFLILTWQKIAPLFMLSFINYYFTTIIIFSLFSVIMGSLMAINQTNMQLIITYSSISHLGWMLSTILINNMTSMIYLMFYILLLIPLMNYLNNHSNHNIYNLTQQTSKKTNNNILIITLILSLSGMPPFMGFISKLLVLLTLINVNLILFSLILFIGTLISLYFYLNMILMLFIKSYFIINSKNNLFNTSSFFSLNIISIFIFMHLLIIFMIYAMIILNKS